MRQFIGFEVIHASRGRPAQSLSGPWDGSKPMKDHEKLLTQEELLFLLHYDPDTGVFEWTKDASKGWHHHLRRGVAGTIDKKGYRAIMIKGQKYKAHRLAWMYITGVWPVNQIDHINNIKDDNRFSNLREASNAQNVRNQGMRKSNSSGFRGVGKVKRWNRWYAAIFVGGKRLHLGFFRTAEEASVVYEEAAKRYGGEFYRPLT